MKKEKTFKSLEAIKDNPKAMRIYNSIIDKTNATQGIHKKEHLDGMGGNKRTQWYYGSPLRAPKVENKLRSTTHSTTVSKIQYDALHIVRNELKNTVMDEAIKKELIGNTTAAIDAVTKGFKNGKPLTEMQLLNILHTDTIGMYPTLRKKKTNKFERHLVKQMGRKRAKRRMKDVMPTES